METPKRSDVKEQESRREAGSALVLICGAPCTGKTTLGKRIATDLALPFISKDDVKEILFNHLGWQDRTWSRRLSLASFDILYYMVDAQLEAGRSLIVEANFRPPWATQNFRALKNRHSFMPIQIFLTAEPATIRDRFKHRAAAGQRHPGHVDEIYIEELPKTLADYRPLEIEGHLFELDSTDFDALAYENLKRRLEKILYKRPRDVG